MTARVAHIHARYLGLLVVLISAIARADSLSLPLNGYFHPGRAMPVKWEIAKNGPIDLNGSGVLDVHIDIAQTVGVLPLLVIGRDARDISFIAGAARGHDLSAPLRALDDSQSLWVTTLDDGSWPKDIFPGKQPISLTLNFTEIQGSAMAWETLDALAMSGGQLKRMPPDLQRGLFCEGVTLAVHTNDNPGGQFEWQQQGEWWIASAGVSMPPIVNPDAYAPTDGWVGGRSFDFRRTIFILGAVFCLLCCGILLWRPKRIAVAILALCAISVMGFAIFNQHRSPIAMAAGEVYLPGTSAEFLDTWLYQRAHAPADFGTQLEGYIHPVVQEAQDWDKLYLELVCDSAGAPKELFGSLPADMPFALMSRRLAATAEFSTGTTDSPLRLLATPSVYPGLKPIGQTQSADPRYWPTVAMGKP